MGGIATTPSGFERSDLGAVLVEVRTRLVSSNLKYSDQQWRLWNNRLLYQNRLRPVDFLQLAEGAGLQVVLSRFTAKEALLKVCSRLWAVFLVLTSIQRSSRRPAAPTREEAHA